MDAKIIYISEITKFFRMRCMHDMLNADTLTVCISLTTAHNRLRQLH